MKKHLALKIALALLPALILTQNWAWMSANKILGIAFLVLWALCVWLVLRIEDKAKIISQLLRIAEIGLFLLPISALVLTFVMGSQVVTSTEGAAQAGAAIGVGIAGMMAVLLGFIIGVAGGVIMHLLAKRFEKKITDKTEFKGTNFFEKHRAVTVILAVLLLIIIASVKSADQNIAQPNSATKDNSAPAVQTAVEPSSPEQPKEPSPISIEKSSVTRDMIGTPEANVTLKNISKKEIDGVKARIKTFNNFDEPVNGFLDDNTFEAISQDKIQPGKTNDSTWTLYNFDGTSKIKVEIYHVHFTDGTAWEE